MKNDLKQHDIAHLRYLKWKAKLTPEKYLEVRRKQKEAEQRYRARMTPEHKAELLAKRRIANKINYANLSPEKREQRLEAMRQRNRNLTVEQRIKENERTHQIRVKQKLDVLSHYSNGVPKCNRCGYTDIRALSLDHINGGGKAHMREIGRKRFYDWILQNKFPLGFQVLCLNCQFIKKIENKEDRPINRKYTI